MGAEGGRRSADGDTAGGQDVRAKVMGQGQSRWREIGKGGPGTRESLGASAPSDAQEEASRVTESWTLWGLQLGQEKRGLQGRLTPAVVPGPPSLRVIVAVLCAPLQPCLLPREVGPPPSPPYLAL